MAGPPSEGAVQVDNFAQLIKYALVGSGVLGLDESLEGDVFTFAIFLLNGIIGQWARKRWLTYRLQDYSFVTTGAQTYSVGNGQTVNINPRPDRIEYAFLRFLNQVPSGNTPVDIPIEIISSHEDYSRITVKSIGTLPWRIFYDPVWPVGLLFPWPVPQATIYEIHVGFKVVLPRFTNTNQPINFPPEYETALYWTMCRRLRASFQLPPDPATDALARDALNTIRLANQAVGVLRMPRALRGRNRAYDYRGDTDDY